MITLTINPLVAGGVLVATAVTDAAYVLFSAAVSARRRVAAANWSGIWYLLSAFAVISYTQNALYVLFAAAGSWLGAYASMTWLRRDSPPGNPADRRGAGDAALSRPPAPGDQTRP